MKGRNVRFAYICESSTLSENNNVHNLAAGMSFRSCCELHMQEFSSVEKIPTAISGE